MVRVVKVYAPEGYDIRDDSFDRWLECVSNTAAARKERQRRQQRDRDAATAPPVVTSYGDDITER